MKGNLRI